MIKQHTVERTGDGDRNVCFMHVRLSCRISSSSAESVWGACAVMQMRTRLSSGVRVGLRWKMEGEEVVEELRDMQYPSASLGPQAPQQHPFPLPLYRISRALRPHFSRMALPRRRLNGPRGFCWGWGYLGPHDPRLCRRPPALPWQTLDAGMAAVLGIGCNETAEGQM